MRLANRISWAQKHVRAAAKAAATRLGHDLRAFQPSGERFASSECKDPRCGMGVSVSDVIGERAMHGAAVTFRCPGKPRGALRFRAPDDRLQ